MKIKSREEHIELFGVEDNLYDFSYVEKYLEKVGCSILIDKMKMELEWKHNRFQRSSSYKTFVKKNNIEDINTFVYIKFIICNGTSYAAVCGETTSKVLNGKRTKPLGDLSFTTNVKKGLSKKMISKYKYKWDYEKIVVIPTSSKYESKRLEGKILFDLNLMST
ncbi:hypothetical protein RZE82_08750 [Mollicutes bacterium LVI A0039]|nr:hypothetical protein RZE82_08750 [Mollicutes bacterium LVI A0039]